MKTERNRDEVLPMGWLDANTPTCRIKRIRKREGRCYELAMRGCLQAPEWELVHGECNGHSGTRKIGHAWLEFDGEAYCPVLDETMPISDFLRILGARAYARYSSEDCSLPAVQVRALRPLGRRLAEFRVSAGPAGLGGGNSSGVSGNRLEPYAGRCSLDVG